MGRMGLIRQMGRIRQIRRMGRMSQISLMSHDSFLIAAGLGGACPTLPALLSFHLFTFSPFHLLTFSPFHFLTFHLLTFSRCFLGVVECCADGVLGQLLYLASGEEGAHAGLVLLDFRLGLEQYVH